MLNFSLLPNGLLSQLLLEKGIVNFNDAVTYIHQLPYGRNTDRSNYQSIISENKGTCATKHAFLKQLAIENQQDDVQLFIGIYKMNAQNTSGIGKILTKYQLPYIPEAHTYLKINGNLLDITRITQNDTSFVTSLLVEEEILPYQIGAYKVTWHQQFLKQWIDSAHLSYSFEEIWKIREECILALSEAL